jgi:hypothetical protein
MGISNLPKPGIKFRTTTGPGNFAKKLSSATRYGDLKNLRDNKEAIVKIVKDYEKYIRIKGGLTRLQKRDAWLKLKKSTPHLTYADKYEAKAILNYLGRGTSAKANKPSAKAKGVKASDGKSFLTEKQIENNLRRNFNERKDYSGVRNVRSRGALSHNYQTLTSSIGINTNNIGVTAREKNVVSTIGAHESLIKSKPTGFASSNQKLPNNPSSSSAPRGVEPIIKLAA